MLAKEKKVMMYWGYLFSDHEIYAIGWYDMTDWDKGWKKLFADVMQRANNLGLEPVHAIRGDTIEDLIEDLVVLMDDRNKGDLTNVS